MVDNIVEVEKEEREYRVNIISIITDTNGLTGSILVTEGDDKSEMRIVSYGNSRFDCKEILHDALSWTLEELKTIGRENKTL